MTQSEWVELLAISPRQKRPSEGERDDRMPVSAQWLNAGYG